MFRFRRWKLTKYKQFLSRKLKQPIKINKDLHTKFGTFPLNLKIIQTYLFQNVGLLYFDVCPLWADNNSNFNRVQCSYLKLSTIFVYETYEGRSEFVINSRSKVLKSAKFFLLGPPLPSGEWLRNIWAILLSSNC